MDRRLALALRIAVSVAMLGLLATRVHDLSSLLPRWHPSTAAWMGAALLTTLTGILLAAWRWSRVLDALETPVAFRPLLSTYLAALFIANFLPSTVGGDVLRIRRMAQTTGEPTVTFASVVLERMTGWIVLPLISIVALTANPGLRAGSHSRVATAVAVTTLVGLGGVLVAAGSTRLGGRLVGHENWIRFLGAVHLGIDRIRRHPVKAASVLTAGFAYQLIVVLAAWFTAQALDVHLSSTAALAFVPIVAIVQVLPLSLGGLGVREGALAFFLSPFGVPTGRGVALGLLLYLLNLVASLSGAPAFAMGGPRSSSPTSVAA